MMIVNKLTINILKKRGMKNDQKSTNQKHYTKVVTGKKISYANALKLLREEYGNNVLLKDVSEEISTYECSIEQFLEIATKIDMKVED